MQSLLEIRIMAKGFVPEMEHCLGHGINLMGGSKSRVVPLDVGCVLKKTVNLSCSVAPIICPFVWWLPH